MLYRRLKKENEELKKDLKEAQEQVRTLINKYLALAKENEKLVDELEEYKNPKANRIKATDNLDIF